MSNIEKVEIELVNAEIRKIDAETEEIKKRNSKWIRILKFVGAGIALTPIIFIYIMQIIKPTIEKSAIQEAINKKNLELLVIKEDSIKRNHENEKEEWEKTIIVTGENLQNIENKLEITESRNDSLIEVLLRTGKFNEAEITSIKSLNKPINKNLDSSMNHVRSMIASNQSTILTDVDPPTGWLYVGHFKNNIWGNTNTIDIKNNLPEIGGKYPLIKDYWLNESFPKFPSYKIPKALTMLSKGTLLEVLALKENIGFNKVWIEVKIIKSN